ncbi:MAG: serine hydrolase domain-containing protein [Bacteroidia bacterium]
MMKHVQNMSLLFLPFFIQLLFLSSSVSAQQDTTLATQFENALTSYAQLQGVTPTHYAIYERMKLRKVPAVGVAVIKKGEIVLSKVYGEANIEQKTEADTSTLFHFASISKTANALFIMKLVEEGKLSLTTDMREYLKEGSFKENNYSKGQKITIANLLSHTAGIIRDDGPSGDYTHNKPLPTITQIVKGEKPALGNGAYCIRKPNETYEYSNQGICIVQKILADNVDEDYNRLLTQHLFTPLNMHNSTFALKLSEEKQKKLAKGYVFDYEVVPPYVFPCQAEGGLVATVSDIAKMVIAIQNAYNEKGNAFLKKETIQKMFTPQLGELTYTGSLDVPYKNGLGVMLFEKGGRKYFTHTGSIDGYTSVYVGSFDGKDGAVIVVNTSYAGMISEVLNSIATTFQWEGYLDYTYKTAIIPKENLGKDYLGTYKLPTEKGAYFTTITQVGKQLYIQNSSDGTPEPLYFSSDKAGFVLSRSYTVEFASKGKKSMIILKNNGSFSGEAMKVK